MHSVPEFPILLVDDEEIILSSMEKVLKSSGINNILTCQDSRKVLGILDNTEAEVMLLDLSMPHVRGEDLLSEVGERHPHIPVIIVTASDDIGTAVRCMKEGAFDYMVKAVEPSRLISGVRRAIDVRSLSRRYGTLRANLMAGELQYPEYFTKIITRNRQMQAIFGFIEAIAPCDETILVSGDTGTGKELFAEAIHVASRRKGDLIKVNTAGLDETMFSDTLFGHVKGAYTGAEQERKGLVQQANFGTLFLDEIGDLGEANQIKLLRLLESWEFYALGSDIIRTTTARFVVATHQNVPDLVASGRFRRDLYYRLQTHEIRIPPLKDRKDDLPLLLDFFLNEAAERLGKKRLAVPSELLTLLETYDFPGNIRELRSMAFSAVSRQREKMLSIQPFREAMGLSEAIPRMPQSSAAMVFPDHLPTLKEVTENIIDEALARSKGNQAIAAGILGISPQALSKRLIRKRLKD